MKNFIKTFILVAMIMTASFAVVNNVSAAIDENSGTGCSGCGGSTGGSTGGNQGGGDHDRDPLPPICNALTADKTSLPYGGGTVNLTWSTTRGTSATLTPDGAVVAVNGSKAVSVTNDITYVLRVSNTAGSASCQVKIDVKEPVVETAPKCDSFTLSPASLPVGGGNVTLSWVTTDAGTVTIDNGVGTVAADGSKVVAVTQGKTFTLTAAKAGQSNASCTASVVVANPAVISCANNVNFTASPTSLPVGGGNVTLSWATTGLNNVSVNGVNANSGSSVVNVTNNTTYTLTGGANGQSVSCPVNVTVATRSGGGGGGSSSPKCTLKISDKSITAGEEVTLTWTTTRVNEITLKDNHGNVIIKKTDDKDDLDSSIKIRPTEDTTYTLLAEKGSRDKTCKVDVDVKNGVSVTEIRNQGKVAGIALSQVPYTGFEAGPMLTTIFYILLTLWGLFVAYLVAVRRNMIGGVSLAGAHDHVAYTDASGATDAAQTYVATVTEATVPTNLPTGIAPIMGYAALAEEVTTEDAAMTELEAYAHAARTLFSSDALRMIIDTTTPDARIATLEAVITKAKGMFPNEDGWLVVNQARLEVLLAA